MTSTLVWHTGVLQGIEVSPSSVSPPDCAQLFTALGWGRAGYMRHRKPAKFCLIMLEPQEELRFPTDCLHGAQHQQALWLTLGCSIRSLAWSTHRITILNHVITQEARTFSGNLPRRYKYEAHTKFPFLSYTELHVSTSIFQHADQLCTVSCTLKSVLTWPHAPRISKSCFAWEQQHLKISSEPGAATYACNPSTSAVEVGRL